MRLVKSMKIVASKSLVLYLLLTGLVLGRGGEGVGRGAGGDVVWGREVAVTFKPNPIHTLPFRVYLWPTYSHRPDRSSPPLLHVKVRRSVMSAAVLQNSMHGKRT